MSATKLVLLTLCLTLLTAPVADAAIFKGRTSQDRRAKVETNDRGFPVFLAFYWHARCSDGGRLVLPTGFQTPFDERTKTFVRDAGSYSTRVRKGERVYRVRVKAHVRARRVTRRRWRGTFGASAVVRRDGRFVARCETGAITWRASR